MKTLDLYKTFKLLLEDGKGSPADADPHEIMTACVCLLGKEKVNNGRLDSLDRKQMDSLISQLARIAVSSKLVGKNDKEVASITQSKIRYTALCQAISAAKEILNHWKYPLNYVILTGRSWHSDVSQFSGIENLLNNFGIDSYGMKDFNSSDIILCDKSSIKGEAEKTEKFHCLGVSLKKKEDKKSAADPTILNRSVFDALAGEEGSRTPEQQKIADEIEEAFGSFYRRVLAENAESFASDVVVNYLLHPVDEKTGKEKKVNKKYAAFLSEKNPQKALKQYLITTMKSLKQDEWKEMLGSSGIMCVHESREAVRKIINKELGGKQSAFRTLLSIIQKQSKTLANALIAIIYKGDLETLKKYNFDFSVCIGTGDVSTQKKQVASGHAGQAKYIPISSIAKSLSTLQSQKLKPNITISAKQKNFSELGDDDNIAAKLFFDLNVGTHPIANLEVRYKGSYTSSPQVFAVMSPEFDEYLNTGKWKNG